MNNSGKIDKNTKNIMNKIKIFLVFFIGILCSIVFSNKAYAAGAVAVIYGDETNGYVLVFQSDNTQNTSVYGTYVAEYTGFETTTYAYSTGEVSGIETSSVPWFDYATGITKVVFETTISPKSTGGWFYNCTSLTEIEGLSYLDTTNVTKMGAMFDNCTSLTSLDLSTFNTTNLVEAGCMFSRCTNLTSLNLSSFDTTNMTDMGAMFQCCSSLTNLDVSNFNTANVTNMSYMFNKCNVLTDLDVSNFNTANVTDMEAMFQACSSLTNLDVSNFNTANVTNMAYMFSKCNVLTDLDVSNFNTANVTDMEAMFQACSSVINLDVSNFNTANVTNMAYMFSNCNILTDLDVSNFNTTNVMDMSYMFNQCNALTNLDVSNFNTVNVTNMKSMFQGCSNLINLDISNFDTANVTNMRSMFYNCNNFISIDVSNFNTTNVTDMAFMFAGYGTDMKLEEIKGINNFNTSNVTSMRAMFQKCSNLTNLDLSNFDTINTTDMAYMFASCSGLKSLNLSSFNTNNVTNMSYMFSGNSSLGYIIFGNDFCWETVSGNSNSFSSTGSGWRKIKDSNGAELSDVTAYTGTEIGSLTSDTTPVLAGIWQKVYAVLYGDDINGYTLVFQLGNTPKDYGLYIAEYTGFEENTYSSTTVPWASYATLINKVVFELDISPISTAYWFYGFERLTNIEEIEKLNTNNVTNMRSMFQGCSNLINLDISNFDTANVTNMRSMFYNCNNLISIDVSNFNTTNVTNMAFMFAGYGTDMKLEEIKGINNFNTSNVTDMSSMFQKCSNLTNLDLSNFDTANVTGMSYMFTGCSGLKSLNLSSFNTNNVTNMSYMFSGNSSLGYIIFGKDFSWETVSGNSNSFSSTGSEWRKIKDSDGAELSDVTAYTGTEIGSLTSDTTPTLAGTWQKVYAVLYGDDINGYTLVFQLGNTPKDYGLYVAEYTGFEGNTYSSTTVPWASYATLINKVVFELDISPISTAYWFYGFEKLTNIEGIEKLNTSNVTDMSSMFYNCTSLESLDLSNFNTTNVISMKEMFYNDSALSYIVFGNDFIWETTSGEDNSFSSTGSGWKKVKDGNGSKLTDLTEYTGEEIGTLTSVTTPTLAGTWQKLTFENQNNEFYYKIISQNWIIAGASNGTGIYTYEENLEKNSNGEVTNYIEISIDGKITIAASTPVGTYTYMVQVTDTGSGATTIATMTISVKYPTLTLDANGGAINGSSIYYPKYGTENVYTEEQGTTIGNIYSPTKTGYTFTGWYTAISDGNQVLTSSNIGTEIAVNGYINSDKQWIMLEDKTLYAQWVPNTYTVEYNGNGATDGITTDSTHIYDIEKNLTPNDYEREYTVTYNHNYTGSVDTQKISTYTFKNWNTQANGSGVSYEDGMSVINLTSTADATVNMYAQWTSASVSYIPTRAGYRFAGWYNEAECTNKVSDGTYTPTANITLYAKWEIDDTQTKDLRYTVEYYKDNIKVDEDTQTVETTVQLLQPDTLTVDKTKINTTDKYVGYKLEKTELNGNTQEIPNTVNTGDVIKVYYVKDEFEYTVEYYYEGILDTSKIETARATYQDVITNYTDKNIKGYRLEKTENLPLTISANEIDNVIKVYYVIDEAQTKDISYTVEYYKDGVPVSEDTQTEKQTVQVLQPDTLAVNKANINTTNKYLGYKFEKAEVNTKEQVIPNTVNNGDVIKIYYIIDDGNTKTLSYTVEYYKDGIKVDLDTQTESNTVQILQPDTLEVNKTKINTVDKYFGYKLDKTELNTTAQEIPDTVNSGDVIKVYYAIDEAQTKELSYTVEYYKDGILVAENTQIESNTVQVLQPDTLDVDKTKINTVDKYVGYKFEKTELNTTEQVIPDEVNSGDVIKVYYVKDEFEYTVEYYYEGVLDSAKTEIASATYQDVITNYIDKNITGYRLEKTENLPLTISSNAENNVIKVYYIIDDENTKTLSYTVEYYKDGVKVEADTQTESNTVQILQPDTLTVDKTQINIVDKYIGYKFEKTELNTAEQTIPDTVNTGDVIKVYYVKDEFEYTVEYYYEGVLDASETETARATYEDIISTYMDKVTTGYKFDKTENLPLTITEKAENNVIKVYYVIDEAQTKELSYTVEYYKEGALVPEDTQIKTEAVQILQPDTLTVDKANINTRDKYFGYKFEKTKLNANVQEIPEKVNNGDTIKVYYIVDEDNKKSVTYTVEYYKAGVIVPEDTQTKLEEVQVLEPDTLSVDKNKINTVDKYLGYKLEKIELNTNVQEVPDIVNSGDIIKVYYVIDEAQTKELSYTVEYYKDGIKVEADTQIEKQNVQILQPDTLAVNKAQINTLNKYAGYKLEKTELNTSVQEVPDTVNNGDVIKVYYIKDQFEYKVEYYYDGILDESKTEVASATYQDVISTYTDKNITGYRLERTENLPLTISENAENNVIKIYYIIDDGNTKTLSYTVEYYKDGVKVEGDTQTESKTVQVLQSDTLEVNKANINIVDKYVGYKFEKIELNTAEQAIPDEVNSGDVIKVYYVKDEFKYTVEYYYGGVLDNSKTEIASATYQDIISTYMDKVTTGYKLESEDNLSLTITENAENNVIKVYYVIDETQTKDLSYTVEYYKNGEKIEADTQTQTQTVQVLQADALVVDKTQINTVDKYAGYKFEKTELNGVEQGVPDVVNNGDVIKVYYIIDDGNTKTLSYTVEYYKNGEKVDADTQTKTQTVQVLQPDTLVVDKTQINATDKYAGYKFEKTMLNEVEQAIPDEVNNGAVIKVYYVIDENNTKQLSYTVEYYKNGAKVDADTQNKIQTVQILKPDTLAVDKTQINTLDKYAGYKFEKTMLNEVEQSIPDEVNNGDIIKVYYVKDEFSYTVEYYYDGILDESKTETANATYEDIISTYTDKNITGYILEKTENLPLTISEYSALNVIKIYYAKDRFGYTVNYYYDGVLDNNQTENLAADYGDIISTYTDKIKGGYEFEKTENLPLTVSEASTTNVINVYYVRKNAQVIVKYVDKNTGEEISDEVIKNGKVFDEFDIAEDEKGIEGYTLVESPNPTTGTSTEEVQTKTYYYAKNTEVIVKYLEKDETSEDSTDNKVLAEEETIEGYEGKEYTTSQKDIENYTFVESTENTSGTMAGEPTTVIYYYIQNTKVVVNHIDKNSDEILESIEENGLVGDKYTSEAKNFDGYVLVERPEEETVTMTKEVITLNYYYEKISAGVIEKHIDIKTNKILDNTLYEGNEEDSYTTSSKTFEGYDIVTNIMYYTEYIKTNPEILEENEVATVEELLDKLGLDANESYIPENYAGIMSVELIEVKYYYIRKSSVIEQHIDKITGELLEPETMYTGHEGDEYKTAEKVFEGYDLVENEFPENSTGTMLKAPIEVKYYYVKKTAVIEKHIDITTEELLEPETTHEGHEGDVYKAIPKEFENYDLVEDKLPENSSGTVTKAPIEVNYYYIRKAKVVVEYIDKTTGEKLQEIDETTGAEKDSTEIIEGHVGDSYKTEEKTFEKYRIVKENYPTNIEGTMTANEDGTIYVRYYYVLESAGVVEKHIDIMTGKLLEEETTYTGYEGDSYTTSSKNFESYDLVTDKLPENASGTMTREVIEVKYYYVRKAKVIVRYIDKDTNKELASEVTIEGHEGDKYSAESKTFNGYNLVEIPKNSIGTMTEKDIIVTYYYGKKAEEKTSTPNVSNTQIIYNTTIIKDGNSTPTTTSTSATSTSAQITSAPKTGDNTPIIAIITIFIVIVLNLIQAIRSKKKNIEK